MIMNILAIGVLVIYAAALLFIFSYSIVQLNLVFVYLKKKFSEKISKKEMLLQFRKWENLVGLK